MVSENRPYMERPHHSEAKPLKGESVFDLDRQEHGIVTRRGPSDTVYVKFGDAPEVMYTLRTSLGVWKAFPGPASAQGLRSIFG